MNFRTDLAIEAQEVCPQSDGIEYSVKEKDGIKTTTIQVLNTRGEKAIGKPKGRYITIETENFDSGDLVDTALAKAVSHEIAGLLPSGNALVCGIGNIYITPDALGPKCVSGVLATRHIGEELAKTIGFENLRSVSAISPGVLGQTGIEITEILMGLTHKIKPDFIIAIDALASRSLARLGKTIQISSTGIVPGSGVHASRQEISEHTLGVPVISIGVPTVVDANTLANDIAQTDISYPNASEMMVTPKEIDILITRAARLISHSINCALQPDIDSDVLLMLTN